MNNLAFDQFVQRLEMRNVQRADGLDRHRQALIGVAGGARRAQPPARGSEGAQYLRPIESLTFTMVAEAHMVSLAQSSVVPGSSRTLYEFYFGIS